ncbi:hypothetical protein MN116_001801 [Schistosoma mekongi]|uniref:Lethal giant larvae homologue 2 domain-containing protein n=1 Tax=Schistosoma mekongi TaxID=38744 RepID=A0AAE2D816_SCHME|nr:hypothetical protein MN116_001801 [Schistosoma mekongi]
MAQKIFQSFRRIPGHFPAFRKKTDLSDVQGSKYRVSVCSDYGFPSKPTSIAYDPVIDMLAVLTRDGNIYIYGKPGISFSAAHETNAQYIQVVFLTGSKKLVTLTDSDDIYLWELTSVSQTSSQLVQRSCLRRITSQLKSLPSGVPSSSANEEHCHVTALCYAFDGRSILIGTDSGWVASICLNTSGTTDDYSKFWCPPSNDGAINPSRILDGISPDRRQRLRADAVVVLLERPEFPGQLLIGYNSGLSLLFDLRSDRIMALLPWQHGLEAAAWCGGSGQPNKSNSASHPPQLGMRLLTAHSDGSLGVWSLKGIGFGTTTISPVQPPLLQMEEAPSMPYGPFPCKLISKVFWLPSSLGGITVFVGGMPRATYGERHTVSILRGSNIDQAANANVIAARLAAAAEAEDDEEIPDESPLSAPPIHVFDSDAPEHVCLDLPSSLVDLIPVGPVDGPVQILIILCEEEIVVVDLITSGWPFMRPPYLACLHTTSLTTYNLTTQISSTLLSNLEAAGAFYGPEGRFGRGGAIADNPSGGGWSSLPWPIQGGHALINGSRLSTSSLGGNILYTDDLLLTGHEDGSVAFWRLSAGGCLRRIYTLHTAILFEDVNQLAHANGVDDDGDAWPPFRQAGVFDPFMDDSRVAVQYIYLVDNTLVVGGAAGQIIVYQFLNFTPCIEPAIVPIKKSVPGFQWKGHAPLTLRTCFSNNCNISPEQTNTQHPAQLQATGVIFVQPPARITSLLVSEFDLSHLKEFSQSKTNNSGGGLQVLLALGTPHGFGVVFVPKPLSNNSNDSSTQKSLPPQPLLAVSTIPDNIDALQEAAAGEGWARRRTRELKKSLRDSFRRLKRVRSTKSNIQPVVSGRTSNISRAGIRRTVTQSNRGASNQTDGTPLDEAERRSGRVPEENIQLISQLNVEREICDRVQDSASVAIVSCFAFGPPLFKSSPSNSHSALHPLATLFIGTKAGTVKLYSIFVDKASNSLDLPKIYLYYSRELILQHRAPVLSLRLIDAKSNMPFSLSDCRPYAYDTAGKSHNLPVLSVVSEEQIRLFNLPNLHLKFKARITATDGYRIKSASVVGFRVHGKTNSSLSKESTVGSACGDLERSNASGISLISHPEQNCEYSFVFTNVGGQAVVLSMPQLRRMDTLHLLDSHDVVAVSSVTFSHPGSTNVNTPCYVHGPALGLYQLAPGQLTLFDVVRTGQKASTLGVSYRPIYRLSLTGNTNVNVKNFSEKTNSVGDSGISNRGGLSNNKLHNLSRTSTVYTSSAQNQSDSMIPHNVSDSMRNGLASPYPISGTSDGITYRNRVS